MTIENDIQELQEEVERLKLKVKSDELKDQWHQSKVRIVYVSVTTYVVALVFMFAFDIDNPFLNAFIPSLLYVFSFQSLPFIRRMWTRNFLHEERLDQKELEVKQEKIAELVAEQVEVKEEEITEDSKNRVK